ncbi:MAG TPA: phBC6A51 family helix-turn-helix protein [Humisphaera sp.]|jgi:hypothetical protein|nr:phBC6A51 family helix-turn-helix protein [Humisphaera sp.]
MTTQTEIIVRSPSAPTPLARAVVPPFAGVAPPEPDLEPNQIEAIKLLTAGEKCSDVARKVGVDRATLWRWRTLNPNFIATLNRWRGEILSEVRDRLLVIAANAADTLQTEIAKGDGMLGYRVLDRMRCMEVGAESPLDPYAIFGIGLDDEAVRRPITDGFARVRSGMTAEQHCRAHELFALGVAMDNRRRGQPTSLDILELAGALDDEPSGTHCPDHSTTENAPDSDVEVIVSQTGASSGKDAAGSYEKHNASTQVKIFVSSSRRRGSV